MVYAQITANVVTFSFCIQDAVILGSRQIFGRIHLILAPPRIGLQIMRRTQRRKVHVARRWILASPLGMKIKAIIAYGHFCVIDIVIQHDILLAFIHDINDRLFAVGHLKETVHRRFGLYLMLRSNHIQRLRHKMAGYSVSDSEKITDRAIDTRRGFTIPKHAQTHFRNTYCSSEAIVIQM